jgi:hypothetical protein
VSNTTHMHNMTWPKVTVVYKTCVIRNAETDSNSIFPGALILSWPKLIFLMYAPFVYARHILPNQHSLPAVMWTCQSSMRTRGRNVRTTHKTFLQRMKKSDLRYHNNRYLRPPRLCISPFEWWILFNICVLLVQCQKIRNNPRVQ